MIDFILKRAQEIVKELELLAKRKDDLKKNPLVNDNELFAVISKNSYLRGQVDLIQDLMIFLESKGNESRKK